MAMYPDLPDDAYVHARQVNMETIHKHDVFAERGGTIGEIRRRCGTACAAPGHHPRWPGWRPASGASRARSAAVMAPVWSAVATSTASKPAAGELAQIGRVPDAAADGDLGAGEASRTRAAAPVATPVAGPDPGQVEHDERADPRVPRARGQVHRVEPRHAVGPPEQPAVLQVEAQDRVGAGGADGGDEGGQLPRVAQRLGADDHAAGPVADRALGVGRRRHAGVQPDGETEPGDGLDRRAMIAAPGDGVEVGHVARVAAELRPEGAGQLDRVGRRRQRALDRAIRVALAPDRVHGQAALEVEHGDDAHDGPDPSTAEPPPWTP